MWLLNENEWVVFLCGIVYYVVLSGFNVKVKEYNFSVWFGSNFYVLMFIKSCIR